MPHTVSSVSHMPKEILQIKLFSVISLYQLGFNIWSLLILQLAGAHHCGHRWTSADHVFKRPSLQVSGKGNISDSKITAVKFNHHNTITVKCVIVFRENAFLRRRQYIGYKHTNNMALFSLFRSGYTAVFIIPNVWSLYVTSVFIGMGAACKFAENRNLHELPYSFVDKL